MADPKSRRRSARAEAKRDLIVDCAMRQFAEHGYQGARIEDMAAELGIAKGSIFQHFGSKAGLFLESYKRAVTSLPGWLDAPDEIRAGGFFGVVRYWLGRTEHYVAEDWVPYRVSLIGNYGTDLELKREINRFMVSEDPYGTLEFVEWGQQRGEVRADLDLETIVSLVDWLSNAIQDAVVSEELDPGLFHRWRHQPDRQRMRLEHFAVLLESAIGSDAARAHVV
ncbi:MAG: TetR/AcrR family transcriptional regulator [Planctomycetaceae bacterium]